MNIPRITRIRGKIGKGDDNKFYFTLSMWNFEGTVMIGGEPLGTFGPWDSEKIAQDEMRNAVELACKTIANGEANGYVDFKNEGQFRPFKSSEQ